MYLDVDELYCTMYDCTQIYTQLDVFASQILNECC